MRQAGRALPEYRALREKHTFLELVQNPELAAEVTLQPVRRFGFDAAILFSDILVVPEAMGQPYHFRDSGGIGMEFALRTKADITRLSAERITERLGYVDKALRLLRNELASRTALIAFAGSPWPLATFMLEGGSAEQFTRAPALFHEDPAMFSALMEKLTAAVTAYLHMQLDAGVDAIQIFDSHGGQLSASEFQEASGRWMREIVSRLPGSAQRAAHATPKGLAPKTPRAATPAIVFSLGTRNWNDLVATGADVLGIDWQIALAEARRVLPPGVAIQGNLAPTLLSQATPETVARETRAVLEAMRGRAGHIFNLGHGVPPDARLENISALVETVRDFK